MYMKLISSLFSFNSLAIRKVRLNKQTRSYKTFNRIQFNPVASERYLFIPMSLIAVEGGPIKMMFSSPQSSANSIFSERKP